jgi:hypothetical protein
VVGSTGTIKANITSALVDISGGSIDDTTVGLSTPAASAFTKVTSNDFIIPSSTKVNIIGGIATVVDRFSIESTSMKRYIIKIQDTILNEITGMDLLLVHNGTTVHFSEYGIVHSNEELGTFTSQIIDGEVTLAFTPVSMNNTQVCVFKISA